MTCVRPAAHLAQPLLAVAAPCWSSRKPVPTPIPAPFLALWELRLLSTDEAPGKQSARGQDVRAGLPSFGILVPARGRLGLLGPRQSRGLPAGLLCWGQFLGSPGEPSLPFRTGASQPAVLAPRPLGQDRSRPASQRKQTPQHLDSAPPSPSRFSCAAL